jgi:hypothetical protein
VDAQGGFGRVDSDFAASVFASVSAAGRAPADHAAVGHAA